MKTDVVPTRVRYVVVASTALMAVLLYLDRFCISFAEIFIKEELGLTDGQIGWILGMFFLTYALGQVPAGWLTDRVGARLMLTTYILGWSLFTGLTGAAFGFVTLLLLRGGFGFAQAGAYPTSASLISKWVPFSRRGTASSVVAIGGRIGGALAPLLTGLLIVYFVPLSVPSDLTPGDLLDAPRLCYEIQHGTGTWESKEPANRDNPAARVGERILQLAPEIREAVVRNSRRYARALEAERWRNAERGESPRRLVVTVAPPAQEEMEQLTRALNAILRQSDLYSEAAFAGVTPEKQARRLLALNSKRELALPEQTRLNRLLLEGVYRDSIRKVFVRGWRRVMFVYGLLGVCVAAFFWFVFRNRPDLHPRCNAAEVRLIESSRPPEATQPHGKVAGVPMRFILRSRSLWLISLTQFGTCVGWVLLVTWAPRYFLSAHKVDVETRAWMVFIPIMVGWLGMIAGGPLTDRLVGTIGLRWGRSLPISLSRFTAMAAYLFCLYSWHSPWVAVAAFSVVSFSTDLGTSALWAYKQDAGGRYVGSILGWGNMWGNLGAFFASRYLISLVGQSQNWNAVFLTCATAFLISGIAALGVDARVPIVPQDEQDKRPPQ